MTLTNLDSAGLIKAFVGYCYPKELVTFSVVHSGQIKKITGYFDYIDRIEAVNTVTTKKTSLSAVTSNDDWYHDRDAGVVYYYTTAPSVVVVLRFGFFFKTGDTEVFKTGITSGELVYYHGRMDETSFNQSIDDISTGTLGVYSTTINFINEDGFYNYLAKDNVSFIGSDIVIYLFVNDITNNAVVFKGTVEQAKYSGYDFSLSVKDINKLFSNQPKYTTKNFEFSVTSSDYPNANANAIGSRIPYILGRKLNSGIKANKIKVNDQVSKSYIVSEKREKKLLEAYSKGNLQVYFYDLAGSPVVPGAYYGNTNVRYRKYISCITDNQIQTFPSVLTLAVSKVTSDTYQYSGAALPMWGSINIEVPDTSLYFEGQCLSVLTKFSGDPVLNYNTATLNEDSPHFYIGRINHTTKKLYCYSSCSSYLQEAYPDGRYDVYFHPVAVYMKTGDNSYVVSPAYITTNTYADGRYMHVFYIKRFAGLYGHNSFSVDSNSNDVVKIFDFDSAGGVVNDTTTELNEQDFFVLFAQQNTNLSLGNMIHKTARWAGFETDGGTGYSYTANPCSFKDLDTKIGSTTFDIASTDGESYLDILQKMLSSVFGFLYLQNDGKIGVRLFENRPYGCNIWAVSEDDIGSGSIDSEFDCSEIKTSIKYIGPNGEDFPKYKVDLSKIQLHGDIIKEDENFLESQSIFETKVLNRKYAYVSSPIKKFQFTIINNGYEITLGDIIKVSFTISQKWLGVDKEFELFVIGVNKSLRGVDITAIENTFPTL